MSVQESDRVRLHLLRILYAHIIAYVISSIGIYPICVIFLGAYISFILELLYKNIK